MYIVGNEKTIKLFEKVVKQWSQNKDNNWPIGWKNGKPVYRNNMENEELKAVAVNPIKEKPQWVVWIETFKEGSDDWRYAHNLLNKYWKEFNDEDEALNAAKEEFERGNKKK